MPDFIGVFGFGITRPTRVGIFRLEPYFTQLHEARDRAEDSNHFFLTAVGQFEGEPHAESIFDLAAAMTFCQQRWVVVNGPFRQPGGATLEQFSRELPAKLEFPVHREGGGPLIMEDAFAPESRQTFLDLCLRRLDDQPFIERTGFRKAFFRSVEMWRMDPAYVDLTYYLGFSAVEILARTMEGDRGSSFAEVATRFLRKLGFDVVQHDPSRRVQAIQTYADLRNALFHEGEFEARVRENSREIVLKLADYVDYLHRLVPDVLLKVLGFEDGHINWNRWLDRMPFGA